MAADGVPRGVIASARNLLRSTTAMSAFMALSTWCAPQAALRAVRAAEPATRRHGDVLRHR